MLSNKNQSQTNLNAGFFCEENECKTEKNLFISKQETIKHNKGNDGDATTLKVNLMRLKRQPKKSLTKINFSA